MANFADKPDACGHLGAMQTGSLRPGRHQVRVRVRDLVARAEAERTVEFVME